jgi:hypothetical protein
MEARKDARLDARPERKPDPDAEGTYDGEECV